MPVDCCDDHKKQSMEFVKECLAKEPSEPIVDVTDAPKILDVDVEQLKKQLGRQQKQIAALEVANEEASDDADAFYSLLSHMNDTDTHIFTEMMQFLKSKHPLVHERQLKNFDIEE
jgi:hypothetical protein